MNKTSALNKNQATHQVCCKCTKWHWIQQSVQFNVSYIAHFSLMPISPAWCSSPQWLTTPRQFSGTLMQKLACIIYIIQVFTICDWWMLVPWFNQFLNIWATAQSQSLDVDNHHPLGAWSCCTYYHVKDLNFMCPAWNRTSHQPSSCCI